MYKTISVAEYWDAIDAGAEHDVYAFLIRRDGSQTWGYSMKGKFFDHFRQGAVHNQNDIISVVVPVDFGKSKHIISC